MKVLELFGGIGACSKALERLEIEHEIVDYVEIDKYAVKSFNAIHETNFEPQDIITWDKDIDVDLIMHGSPCQDFSIAGKQQGGDEGSGTRSSLLYETIRIVAKLKPKYVIWENVKNVISKKHRHNFDNYLEQMESLGYTNYYQVLNAKDYGIPQNRERVFTISILNPTDIIINGNYHKSNFDASRIVDVKGIAPTVKENHGTVTAISDRPLFTFPPKQELQLRLKDMLEDEVDEKYYLSDKMISYVLSSGTKNFYYKPEIDLEIARPLSTDQNKRAGTTNYFSESYLKNKDKRLKQMLDDNKITGNEVLNIDLYNQTTNKDISQCLTEPHHNSQRLFDGLRIRKLTPKECWRLMGFDDTDFDKASRVNSNSQLYKQAGNSIVVNVLEAIFKNLFNLDKEAK